MALPMEPAQAGERIDHYLRRLVEHTRYHGPVRGDHNGIAFDTFVNCAYDDLAKRYDFLCNDRVAEMRAVAVATAPTRSIQALRRAIDKAVSLNGLEAVKAVLHKALDEE